MMAGNDKYLFVKVVVPYCSSGFLFAVVPHEHVGKLDNGETVGIFFFFSPFLLFFEFSRENLSCLIY
jgi:hypothetical protein